MSQEVQYKDPRVYEIGYLLLPTLSEEEAVEATDKVRKIITDATGLPLAEEKANLMTLAYSMSKTIDNVPKSFTQAYFGWIKFDVTPDRIAAINLACGAFLPMLRHLCIATVREDTRAKRARRAPSSRTSKSRDTITGSDAVSEKADVAPMDIAKVDKEIEELANIE